MAQEWYKVDNVAKVFLATNTRRDPRGFRISCTLQEQIDPELLNEALRVTAPEWPQFQVTLHRGLFWHYFESTDQLPTCHPEDKAPCAPLYVPERRNRLIYRVTYFGSRINLEVDFFGGEPLMNWDVVKQLVEYARSVEKERGKNFRFTLTTNGMLIDDDVIDFANREMSNVVLSLDGRKEIHDRLRVDYAGNGSYERIVPKFQKLVEARGNKNYYMRGTFTHANPDFTKDLFHMADLGFTELSMEPVVAAHGDPAALTEADKEIVMQQYEELARLMLQRDKEGRPFTFYHYMIDLKGGPCIYKRISGCGSGTEYMAVTPWGDLYPCHQFVGDEKFKLGNIWDGVENHAVQAEFAGCNVYAREECRDCWARLYCSGGCAANAYHATGSVRGVYADGCDLFRKRMECAIMIKVAENQELAAKGIEVPIELGSTCNACADGEACE